MRVLVIGAAGRVGSAALAACLAKNHVVTAFVRNPAKLPLEVRTNSRLRIIKGDATCHASLVEAIHDQDAVIQAAVYSSKSPSGISESETVIRSIVSAIQEVQKTRPNGSTPIRLWVLSGQVLLDIPGGKGRVEGNIVPIRPEHYQNYAFLQQDPRDVDRSLLCPGKIEHGEPTGSIGTAIDKAGLWQQPRIVGKLLVVGPLLNFFYNFRC